MNRSSVLARFCLCLIVLTVLITFFISIGHPYSHIFFNPEKEVAEEAYVSMSAIVTGKTERENGQTLILVTHDRSIADYADKIVTIQDGNIIKIEEKGKGNEIS